MVFSTIITKLNKPNFSISLLLLIFLASFSLEASKQLPISDQIDALALKTLQEWQIPGLSLCVVQGNQDHCIKGFGVKNIASNEPVDEQTLFQVCSLSKAFTACVISQLVQSTAMDWYSPIISYCPNFCLKNCPSAASLTMSELLSHRSGLCRPGNFLWWRVWWLFNEGSRRQLERIQYLNFDKRLKTFFSYNNLNYLLAGSVAEIVTDKNWSELLESYIFKPLDMNRTGIAHDKFCQDKNAAIAHYLSPFPKAANTRNWQALAPAGGMYSSASDMHKWLRYCLSMPDCIRDTLEAQAIFDPKGFMVKNNLNTWPLYLHNSSDAYYCMGWIKFKLQDESVYFHLGLTDGMQSLMAIIPSRLLGIAVMTNASTHFGCPTLMNTLLDLFFELNEKDWANEFKKKQASVKNGATDIKYLDEIAKCSKYQLIEGDYENLAYGTFQVYIENKTLRIRPKDSQVTFDLEHVKDNVFIVNDKVLNEPWRLEFQILPNDHAAVSVAIETVGVFKRCLTVK